MNWSPDTSTAHTFSRNSLMVGVKEMIKNDQLRYTSITKRYYGEVSGFGGVTIYTFRWHFSKEHPHGIHNEVWIRPYADTGRMDDLEIQLPIPIKESIEIYKDWCENRDHSLDADHQANLENLQGRLTIAAINHALKKEKKCTHSPTNPS
ncbi:hypothetical protein F4Z99_04160 [Candidatus Poribacteria bacterium]|nr:hypothetical protein [Candidatus Poribacteria bacterium]